MSKILKVVGGSPIVIADTGVTLPASPTTFTIDPMDYWLWAASSNIVTQIGSGAVVVNDGSADLSIADGVDLIKGIFPQILTGVVDTGNSTTTNLGIGGVFTGSWRDALAFNNIVVALKASHDSATLGFVVQWSNDGSTVHDAESYSLAANNGKQYSFGRIFRYFRIVYTNGAVAQSSFSLQTVLCRGQLKPSSHRIADAIVDDDDAELTKSIITGKTPSGVYKTVSLSDAGYFVVVTPNFLGSGGTFTFGDITSASTALKAVYRTAYNEQTTNAAREIISASANDTAAGTGARTVKITYLDQTGAGPFTETVTMNGTTPVTTTNTNICFIEKMEVITVGSGNSNAGIITLRTIADATIGTIAAGDNITLWSHHYVPTGKTCNITGVSCSNSATVVGGGGVFFVRSKPINSPNAVETQLTEFIRSYGQSSTVPRNYSSPIRVAGPAKITSYVIPETSSSVVYRASIDYFET